MPIELFDRQYLHIGNEWTIYVSSVMSLDRRVPKIYLRELNIDDNNNNNNIFKKF